jgi:hypothetical protein
MRFSPVKIELSRGVMDCVQHSLIATFEADLYAAIDIDL